MLKSLKINNLPISNKSQHISSINNILVPGNICTIYTQTG